MLGTFFVGGKIYILSGIEKGNVDKWSNPPSRVIMVVWGLSLAGGVGVVLGPGGPVGCPWWWSVVGFFNVTVLRARGAPPLLGKSTFSWF